MTGPSLLSVRGLRATFPGPHGRIVAVDGVDFDLAAGEVLGLVGESGSGKSVTLRAILRLVNPPGAISGEVSWRGTDIGGMAEPQLRAVRGREIAIIFQEPMAALNPVLTVGVQIGEASRPISTFRPGRPHARHRASRHGRHRRRAPAP